MPSQSYRFYALSRSGGFDLPDWIEADSDEEAIEIAHRIEQGAEKIEIWVADRLVAVLSDPHDPVIQDACARRLLAFAEKRRRAALANAERVDPPILAEI